MFFRVEVLVFAGGEPIHGQYRLTDYHNIEVEPFSDALAVPLVREVGETDISGQLPTDNIPGIIDSLRGCRNSVRSQLFSDGNFIRLLANLWRLGAGGGTVGVYKQ